MTESSPKNEPERLVRVIDYEFHTKLMSMDDGFPNTGKDINAVPQSRYRVEQLV